MPSQPQERRGGLRGVFAVWFAGNLAITSVVIGAVVASYGLSLVQSLIALLGVASFVLVGYFAVPGMRTGRPTMALSQHAFGTWGNLAPSLLSWLNLVGWETVVLVIASYALAAAYQAAFHARPGAPVLRRLSGRGRLPGLLDRLPRPCGDRAPAGGLRLPVRRPHGGGLRPAAAARPLAGPCRRPRWLLADRGRCPPSRSWSPRAACPG